MVNYRKFFDEQEANELAGRLREVGIPVEVISSKDDLNFIYGDKTFKNQYIVNLRKEDFEAADNFLLQNSNVNLDNVERTHYLFEFSDEELFDILSKPDEWNEFDYQLAQKILRERGKEINVATITLLKSQRISELKKPEDSPRAWVYAGYLFALLGSLLGTFMGYFMMTARKTLPNGERVYTYNTSIRNHGLNIMIVGIVSAVLQGAVYVYSIMNN